ncbi:dTDP-4-dehydrorhamnose 3,5-epimerase [Maricaulis sp.]|uniref:dTDP-4-dehydrorhamnose 3,5-epimerase n=1 Tax=Maricaulis sp. TaxID=1486257 RepID=UPI0026054A96|nr:dTDP-4-dehydrorhamnose 3,5-epimerase [Maricaulis sp.]
MNIEDLSLPGVKLITPRVFGDDRGFFMETFKQSALAEAGIDVDFVQDNHSRSSETGTVRGLHYQAPPFAQSKLVRVVRGSILDVAVDARRGSPHYGQSVAVELSAANFQQLFVPQGFLHGFITLEPETEVVYKVDNYYSAAHDGSVRWDDPALGIDWGEAAASPVLSAKDQAAPLFSEFDNPFEYAPASEIA